MVAAREADRVVDITALEILGEVLPSKRADCHANLIRNGGRQDRRDDDRDQYGAGGRDDRRQGGNTDSYESRQDDYDDRQGGRQGGSGRRGDDNYGRPSGGQGGYGGSGNDRDDNRPQRRDEDYDRRFNEGNSGGNSGRDDRYGGSGGQSEGRYGEQGKPYSGPQSGQDSSPYDAPSSGYDGPHRPQQSGHQGGGGRPPLDNEVMDHAEKDEDKSMFSQALSFLNNKQDDEPKVNEGRMQEHHDDVYSDRPSGNQTSNSLGAAAAMHAFQSFTGGGGSGGDSGQPASGGQGQLLGMVFKEASSLFESQSGQGNVQSGVDKQSVINAAGKQAVKLFLQNQGGGGGGGLMGMVSKFM